MVTGKRINAIMSGIIGNDKAPAPTPMRNVNPSIANGIITPVAWDATGIIKSVNKYGSRITLSRINPIKK